MTLTQNDYGYYVLIELEGYGVQIKRVETAKLNTGEDCKVYFISVPDESECEDEDDMVMAGKYLAAYTQETLQWLTRENVVVHSVSRPELWTLDKQAVTEAQTAADLSWVTTAW
jgi:hypothetical protein